MKRFLGKSAIIGLLSIFSLASLFAAPVGAQAKAEKPKIAIVDRNSNSMVLKVKQDDFEKDLVTIKMRVEKIATGEKFDRIFKVRLNEHGRKQVTIKDLTPGTKYKFMAKIKERGDNVYSNFSDSEKASTKI
ncbi:MAG: hypothetical protein US25_C0003G0016 [Candidatus Moranbacteria bacterium GW2011_GWE1_36_7]|nr:MAG: hypothetical protein UR99_C0014G0016 [Candidatus Moranbacteria bacterium GW2011_GWD2_36_12]KKQ06448.1 MAG: hypothetical protein US16_C0017G0016 [Candidatus Moranbacteria bacterium GW2011_GWE2_36_40]KKQ15498.1 MAG: hypothetical protein US25_C0003G0016 [Candidatus Moranbacteria bacterium GW2011_GWE1_36_7]